MRHLQILLVSDRFPPDVGGIERMSELLAVRFANHGHQVTVVTHTMMPVQANDVEDVCVVGAPSRRDLFEAHRSADVVFHNNICLRFLWPQLLLHRPMVIAVRTWVRRPDGRIGIRDRLKRAVIARFPTISISKAIAADLKSPSTVIPNSYREDQFHVTTDPSKRDRDFVFAGRLVSDKGGDLAIKAVARLVQSGFDTNLTIVGDGPDRESLVQLARSEGVWDRVQFEGSLDSTGVCAAFNRHRFAMLPSRWREPFGVVALEAIACGCVPVVSEGGGLGEAVGRAGLTVPNGNLQALVDAARCLLSDPRIVDELSAAGPEHARSHHSDVMAGAYLEVLEGVVNCRSDR